MEISTREICDAVPRLSWQRFASPLEECAFAEAAHGVWGSRIFLGHCGQKALVVLRALRELQGFLGFVGVERGLGLWVQGLGFRDRSTVCLGLTEKESAQASAGELLRTGKRGFESLRCQFRNQMRLHSKHIFKFSPIDGIIWHLDLLTVSWRPSTKRIPPGRCCPQDLGLEHNYSSRINLAFFLL